MFTIFIMQPCKILSLGTHHARRGVEKLVNMHKFSIMYSKMVSMDDQSVDHDFHMQSHNFYTTPARHFRQLELSSDF